MTKEILEGSLGKELVKARIIGGVEAVAWVDPDTKDLTDILEGKQILPTVQKDKQTNKNSNTRVTMLVSSATSCLSNVRAVQRCNRYSGETVLLFGHKCQGRFQSCHVFLTALPMLAELSKGYILSFFDSFHPFRTSLKDQKR